MEKKAYIKPEIEVIELAAEVPTMLASSLVLNDEGGNEESLANDRRPGRRGKWGDLWYVEDEN